MVSLPPYPLFPRLALALGLAGCLWKPNPGVAPLALAEAPVEPVSMTADGATITLVVMVRAGSAYDPPGREGLAWLSAMAVARGGSATQSAADVQRALAAWGAQFEVEVGLELVTFRLSCPPEHAVEAARLLGALVVSPGLEERALAQLRAEGQTAAAARAEDAPAALASDVLQVWLYEAHPYGHLSAGRPGGLAVSTPLDVAQFLERRYVRSVLTAGVSGPAGRPELESARAALGEQLSLAPPLLSPPTTPRLVPERTRRALLVVDTAREDLSLSLGQALDLQWDEPDGQALATATAALSARLSADLGALGEASARLLGPGQAVQSALVVTVTPSAPALAPQALEAALRTVERFVQDGVEATELTPPPAPLPPLEGALSARLMRWPDPAALANPGAATAPEAQALSPAVVNAAIARRLRPAVWSLVAVVPDAEAFRASLIEYPTGADVQTSAATSGAGSDPGAAPETRYRAGIDQVTVMNATELFR